MVRRQVRPVPAQFPPQRNEESPVGIAVSVTAVPLVRGVAQVPVLPTPQVIPPTLLVTLPVPLPAAVTLRLKEPGGGGAVNVADTVLALFMVRGHVDAVPEAVQFPPQPPNVEPLVGVAVSVTPAPFAIVALQVPVSPTPQVIPPTSLVTLPVPLPAAVTLRL
jgi:hypothetical protein